MASYFDEHDVRPETEETRTRAMLRAVRSFIQFGFMDDENSIFGDASTPPPTSKKFLETELPDKKFSEICTDIGEHCTICLKEWSESDLMNQLPCGHGFHKECIRLWLSKTSSCPFCRHDLPTDDEVYEEFKARRKSEQQRKEAIDTLHSSMFG